MVDSIFSACTFEKRLLFIRAIDEVNTLGMVRFAGERHALREA